MSAFFSQHPPTSLTSCRISQFWSTVFVSTSKVYFSADNRANISQPFSPNTLPPTHLMPYFSNLINCIFLDQQSVFLGRKGSKHAYCQPYSPNTLPPSQPRLCKSPHCVFLKFAQLYLSRHATVFLGKKGANIRQSFSANTIPPK